MRRNYLLLVFILFAGFAFGQAPFRLTFHHLTREEGLSNNNIFCIHRDSRGFLWLGTTNGLNRFDGTGCIVYKPDNSAITGVDIKNIVEDRQGNLWIGSESGLSRYDRKTDKFENIPSPNQDKNPSFFPYCIDNNGILWVTIDGNKSKGLYIYDPSTKKFTFLTSEIAANLPRHQNDDFKEVKYIFCGTSNDIGINKIYFKNNKVTKIESFLDGRKNEPARTHIGEYTLPEGDSIVWVTGVKEGLIKLNTQNNTLKIFDNFDGKRIGSPLSHMTRFGHYLFIGSNNGLFVFDKISEKFVQELSHLPGDPAGLTANWNEIPYVDRNNNLFLSQLGFGLDFTNLNHRNFEQWLKPAESFAYGLADNHVSHLIRRESQTWATLQSAGTIVLDQNGKIVRHFDGFSVLLTDSQNRVWLTNGNEMAVVNKKEKFEIRISMKQLGLPNDVNQYMVETGPGQYLISGNGLYMITGTGKKLEAKQVASFKNEGVVGVHPLFYDARDGHLYLSANWWSALYVLQKKGDEWIILKKPDIPLRVYWIAPAGNGNVWLCTGSGLALMNAKTFEYRLFTEKDGLPDNVVTNLIPEANGNYWLVTNRGISYYNKSKNEYRNFTSRDGANSKEYDWYGNFRLPDGRVVFGGTDGINVIDPHANQSYAVKPGVQITNFYANEQPVHEGVYIGERSAVELNPDQTSFGFDLAGIEFGFPQKIVIQYKLEGIDKQWITARNPSSARYANIPAGNYQFKTRALDETGKLSSDIRQLAVTVRAPFYKTNWFRAGLVLILFGLGYTFFRLRLDQVKAETRYKEEVKHIRAQAEINALRSQMNPHFIFNCMNTIDSYIILNKTNEASEFLQKFSKLVRKILEYSRQEYISVAEDLEALELYIQLEQERSKNAFTYEITIETSFHETEFLIPSMLFQPFVENAILHGLRHKKDDSGELFIHVKILGNQLICNITDNGIGRAEAGRINFFRKHQSKSVGLKLTDERIRKINEIYPGLAYLRITDIDMESDSGTIIEIGLPLLTQENLRS
jgi:ligand-binding sensor domain-containing protein